MLVLVINLDRAPERLVHMRREFARIGADFTRIDATDGQTLDAAGDDLVDALEGRRLSKGEIACFTSHRRAWQMLTESGESHAVILEDDVFLGEDVAAFFRSSDWFPSAGGIVKLETYLAPTTIGKIPVSSVGDRGLHRLVGKHLGAGGYALDRQTAKMLVAASARIDRQVDDFLFDPEGQVFRQTAVHQVSPAVCIQGLKLARLRRLDGERSTFESQLYAERLATRRRPGVASRIRREVVAALSKFAIAVAGSSRNLVGRTRWGRIAFR